MLSTLKTGNIVRHLHTSWLHDPSGVLKNLTMLLVNAHPTNPESLEGSCRNLICKSVKQIRQKFIFEMSQWLCSNEEKIQTSEFVHAS